jgi:hypothetical protein
MLRLRFLLRCLLCLWLTCQYQISQAQEAGSDGDRPATPVVHRQGKYAGRAGNYANLNDGQKQNYSQQNFPVQKEGQERKALSKEERRALRRQVNESVSKYPRRH